MQNPLAAAFGAGLLGLGAGAILAPRWSAGQYGLPSDNPTSLALIRALGIRDIALGGAFLASLSNRRTLAALSAWSTLVALTDAAVVGAVHGWRPQHLIHLSGALATTFAAYAYTRPK